MTCCQAPDPITCEKHTREFDRWLRSLLEGRTVTALPTRRRAKAKQEAML